MGKLKRVLISHQKQIKNFLVYASSEGLSQALPFLVLPFIADELGSEGFGVVANFNVLIQFFLAIMGMRLAFYYSADYYQSNEGKRSETAFNISMLYLTLFGFLSIFLLPFLNFVEGYFLIPREWQYLALFIVFNQLLGQLLTTHLRMAEKARFFGIVQLFRAVLSASLSVLFVIAWKWGWEGRAWAMFSSSLLLGILSISFFKKRQLLLQKYNIKLQVKLLGFGLPMLPYALSPWFKNGVEKLFITQEISISANGVYSLAITLGSVFGVLTSAFFATYTPKMYKILSEKRNLERGKVQLVKQSYLVVVGFLVVLIFGYIFLRILILNFFSDEYAGAVLFLPWILSAVWFGVFTDIFKALIIYSKNTKILGVSGLIMAGVQVPLTYYLILIYGSVGASIASFFGSILLLVVYIFISQRQVGMPWLYFMKKSK